MKDLEHQKIVTKILVKNQNIPRTFLTFLVKTKTLSKMCLTDVVLLS